MMFTEFKNVAMEWKQIKVQKNIDTGWLANNAG